MSDIARFHKNNGVCYYSFQPFDEKGVSNSFSTRIGGSSSPPFAALNMGFHTNDDYKNVITNRKYFLNSQGLNIEQVVCSKQVHSTNVIIVDDEMRGKGAKDGESALDAADGLITACKNVVLMSFYADCVPLYIYDAAKDIIALLHAGWKGTLGRIGEKALSIMQEEFNSSPQDCTVVIGPSIGPCCYEVDQNLITKFKDAGFYLDDCLEYSQPGHYMLDLWKINKNIFREAGVPERNVYISGLCTKCNNDIFFSHRAENGKTGRMAALMCLKDENYEREK